MDNRAMLTCVSLNWHSIDSIAYGLALFVLGASAQSAWTVWRAKLAEKQTGGLDQSAVLFYTADSTRWVSHAASTSPKKSQLLHQAGRSSPGPRIIRRSLAWFESSSSTTSDVNSHVSQMPSSLVRPRDAVVQRWGQQTITRGSSIDNYRPRGDKMRPDQKDTSATRVISSGPGDGEGTSFLKPPGAQSGDLVGALPIDGLYAGETGEKDRHPLSPVNNKLSIRNPRKKARKKEGNCEKAGKREGASASAGMRQCGSATFNRSSSFSLSSISLDCECASSRSPRHKEAKSRSSGTRFYAEVVSRAQRVCRCDST